MFMSSSKENTLELKLLHEWPDNAIDAVEIQRKLSVKVINEEMFLKPETVTAVDTAFDGNNNYLFASAVTFNVPGLIEMEFTTAKKKAGFPYIPGLKAFREGPVILTALARLKHTPEIVIYRGHGIAHPRYFGLASHLGVLTDIPSVGCAMKILAGDYNMPPANKGGRKPMFTDGNEVGCVYRSRTNVKPVFISPGHLCNMEDAVNIVAECLTSYRVPEPLRIAHIYANRFKQFSADQSRAQKE